jgi:hypothetical protein
LLSLHCKNLTITIISFVLASGIDLGLFCFIYAKEKTGVGMVAEISPVLKFSVIHIQK